MIIDHLSKYKDFIDYFVSIVFDSNFYYDIYQYIDDEDIVKKLNEILSLKEKVIVWFCRLTNYTALIEEIYVGVINVRYLQLRTKVKEKLNIKK